MIDAPLPELIDLGRIWGERMRRRAERTKETAGLLMRQAAYECGMVERTADRNGFSKAFLDAFRGKKP